MGMTNDINFEEMATKELNTHLSRNGVVSARKKPVVIKAIQWTGDNAGRVRAFMEGQEPDIAIDMSTQTAIVVIHTLEGDMEASEGDWIIRGVQGEYYPCKPDIFEETYEIVSDEE